MTLKIGSFLIIALIIGIFSSSLITDVPFQTEKADGWAHHECCSTVLVWKQIGTWGSIKAGTYTPVYGYVEETRCDQGFWH